LNDFLRLWTRSIDELLAKLRDTQPGDGMIGEVHYWRDITRVLEAINLELKQPFVEVVIQVLSAAPDNQDHKALLADVKQFQKEKSRVLKGVKEASGTTST